MPSRSGSPCDDKNPHISGGITADGAQVPAARRGKNIARAPFIARLIPVTTLVGVRAPGQPVVPAARADGLQGQQSRTGHPPDDLLLIANRAGSACPVVRRPLGLGPLRPSQMVPATERAPW